MRLYLSVAAASLFLGLTPAQAKEPLDLQPTSAWTMNRSDNVCRLTRTFGEGRQQVQLDLRERWPWFGFDILAVGQPVASGKFEKPRLRYSFEPDAGSIKPKEVGWGKIGGKPALIFHATLTKADKSANFDGPDYSKRQTSRDLKFPSEAELKKNARGPYEPDVDPAREDEIQRLVLSGAFKRDVKIELASMRPAMDKLGTCADDLMKRWGINPEVQKTLKRRPYPEVAPGTWVTTNDYPKSMLRANRSGVVHTILVIDAQGKVSNCLDTATIIQKEFEETTCSLVKERARLYPALDAEGKPVVSFLPFILDFRI